LLRDDGAIKVSRSLKERSAAVRSARSLLGSALGREPSLKELSDHLGLAPEDIAQAEAATREVESIHRECGEEGFTLENVLTDTESEERMLEKIALRQAIAELPEREKCVISLRYFHGLTQDRVAKVLDVSQVQVSRIEKKAIGLLREKIGE
jgi:RNA polymerase sporulation-specific sigma factor